MSVKETAQEVLKKIGGSKNVESVTHCVTRLRFVLRDFSLPNKEEVASIDGVISVIEQGGQYQVVIGNKVSEVYDEVLKELDGSDPTDKIESKAHHKSLFDKFTAMISGIFMPVMGAMAGSGMIKGVLAILTITNLLSEESGTYIILYGLSNAFFYFMPVILGASAAKYFKMDIFVGAVLGAALIYPTFIPFASEGELSFLGISVNMMDYTSTVFPVIVAVWFASKVNMIAEKFMPKDLKFLLVPAIVLLISVPVTLIVIGPIITLLSNVLADAVNAIYNFSPALAGAVIGGPWILMVMFGLHWAFIPIFIANMASQGYDPMMGLLLANQFAMAGATIAVGIKTKNDKLKALSLSTGVTTLFGISEPALYGVLLPNKKPLIAAIIGGSFGGVIAGIANTVQYSFGGSGLLGIPLIINTSGIDNGFYGGIASQIVGFIVGFALTYTWGFKEKSTVDSDDYSGNNTLLNTKINVNDILSGEVVALSEVPDKVFSEGLMGQGLAVIPNDGKVYAPFDGVVTMIFPTKHAIGLTSSDGIELLIHVGVDTVELNGVGFKSFVASDQKISKGDLLLEIDLAVLKQSNFQIITPILITNPDKFSKVSHENNNLILAN
ncbi:beta-glucoside-specific PTS transporter subunit IIABC [Enterococcus sp. RIT-PI-f]|uniref:beta-glucoside-specific PTS transporter subunit IIABC n=1 Tax=Enterococcus sp. RIT-PI-f TaxID=1690244 RepID=UPI0006B9DE15|nr:beta-glucoside-specific PTS transporter subunit IIABC [Enterococcus sp. RIT-PI-f]KPG68460.1 PTS sugar transporter [Enterococcus sp. RIT-PI-f]